MTIADSHITILIVSEWEYIGFSRIFPKRVSKVDSESLGFMRSVIQIHRSVK